jgi:ferrochelatase
MNMGGPASQGEVGSFLRNLFSDGDLIPLPAQSLLAPWIARRRTPSIQHQYAQIGGGSPIRAWTERQGAELARMLDVQSPASGGWSPLCCGCSGVPCRVVVAGQCSKASDS